mgnify:CR=1 FL=1
MSDKLKNMITRAITGTLFVAAVVVCFMRPQAMIFLFAVVTALTVWEYTGLVNNIEGVCVNRFITTAAGTYLFLAFAGFCSNITPSAVFIPYLLTVVYLFISELYTKAPNPINNWAYTMLSQLYIALPSAMINVVPFRSEGGVTVYASMLPLSISLFLWTNDTGAYCGGSLLHHRFPAKLFERVSPKKSWVGSLSGGLLCLLAGYLFSLFCPGLLSLPQWLGMALVVCVFGTWGDLVESLLKRQLGVKDSGTLLPGHGGMLDRFDSSLLAIPAVVIYLYTIQAF